MIKLENLDVQLENKTKNRIRNLIWHVREKKFSNQVNDELWIHLVKNWSPHQRGQFWSQLDESFKGKFKI